jgi:hypothetical protein
LQKKCNKIISYVWNYILYIFVILLTINVHCDRRVNLYIQAYNCICVLIYSSICILNLMLPAHRPDFYEVVGTTRKVQQSWHVGDRDPWPIWLRSSKSLVPVYHFKLKQPRNMERYEMWIKLSLINLYSSLISHFSRFKWDLRSSGMLLSRDW